MSRSSPQRRFRPSARGWFLFYLFLTHTGLAVAGVYLLRDRPLWLFVAEAVFLLLLLLGFRLVRGMFVPIDLIRTGTTLLEEGEFTTRFRPVGQLELDELIEVYNRMADRLKEERLRVREQNEFLDRLIEASPGGVVVCDFEGRIVSLNPTAGRILGAEVAPLVGRSLTEDARLAPLAQLVHGDSRLLSHPSGRLIRASRGEFRDRGFLRPFFLLEELTEELRRSEREAYGKLVRMISHEVNNSVGPVSSLVESIALYGRDLPAQDRQRFEAGLEVAANRLDHLRAFVDGFAAVVKLPPPTRAPCDLDAVLRDVVTLLSPILESRRIACRWRLEVPLGEHLLDKNQIEQVLLNVLKNGYEAIGEEGVIELRSRRDPSGLVLAIEDSGPGLSCEAQANLFRPFYTSKTNGRGIGLTLVNEILTHHGIPFALRNGPDGGAVFELRLAG